LPPDPYGTSIARLYVEAGEEIHVHGAAIHARPFFVKALQQLVPPRTGVSQDDTFLLMARAQSALGDWAAVERSARSLMVMDSTVPASQALLGTALARLGRTAEARAIIQRLDMDRRPYLFGAPALGQARIATALRDTDVAVSHLERAFAAGKEYDLWVHRDSDFDALRALPAFKRLTALKH
jgi:hypothetical protein